MPALPDPRDWFTKPMRVIQAADRDVIRILDQARRDIDRMLKEIVRRPGIGNEIRRHQLLLVKRNLQREQAQIWTRLGDVTRARRLEAAARVLDVNLQADEHLLVDIGKVVHGQEIAQAIARAERDNAERAIDRMLARVNGDSYVPLADRVYNSQVNIGGQLDRMINSALVRGLSAKEFATEAQGFINPNTPGGLRYAAMRLARTEINNAAHAVAIDSVADKPWVEGMKWHLSGSHPKPDKCDLLARGGTDGDGIYPKTSVPAKPHPMCFCYVTPALPSDDDFLSSLLGGKYNDYLEKYSPGIGQRFTAQGGFVPQAKPKLEIVKPKPAKVAKPTPLSQPQELALRFLRDRANNPTLTRIGGNANAATRNALLKKGLINADNTISDVGKKVLADIDKVAADARAALKAAAKPFTLVDPGAQAAAAAADANLARMKGIYGNKFHISQQGKQAEKHLHDLSKVPDSIHAKVAADFDQSGAANPGIFIGTKAVPELSPESARLRGVRPRGYSAGRTWDDVSGAFAPGDRQLLVGDEDRFPHGSNSLALHEFSHAFDTALGQVSQRQEFTDLIDAFDGHALNPYYLRSGNPAGYRSEAFAEAFSSWLPHRAETALEQQLAVGKGLGLDRFAMADRRTQLLADDMIRFFRRLL